MNASAVRRAWRHRSGEFSPRYYAHHGPDETSERLREAFEAHLGPDPSVLELGCSAGRHLAHLYDHGYRDLTGVDLNPVAFDVMEETYPDLAAAGTFHTAAIEDVVARFDAGAFDAVFTVETLQHLHPDHDWVFEPMARLAEEVLVTVEIEGEDPPTGSAVTYVDDAVPLYYRDWGRVFSDLGLTEVDAMTLGRDTLRVFQSGDG